LKFPAHWTFDELKQRLVLTREEKRVIIFILAAFVLGLVAKHYRATHPQPVPYIDKRHPWRKYQTAPSSSPPKSTRRKSRNKNESATPLPSPSIIDQNERGSPNFSATANRAIFGLGSTGCQPITSVSTITSRHFSQFSTNNS